MKKSSGKELEKSGSSRTTKKKRKKEREKRTKKWGGKERKKRRDISVIEKNSGKMNYAKSSRRLSIVDGRHGRE